MYFCICIENKRSFANGTFIVEMAHHIKNLCWSLYFLNMHVVINEKARENNNRAIQQAKR